MLGREVKTLIIQTQDAGYRSVIWNTRNNFGQPVSAGIYFYQIQTKGFVKTRKMVLLKWNASGSNSLFMGAFLFIKETPTLLGDCV